VYGNRTRRTGFYTGPTNFEDWAGHQSRTRSRNSSITKAGSVA